MTTSDTTQNLLDAVDRIGPLIKEHAAEAEADRQLSRPVYDAMYRAGLFAMLAPKARGGIELHPSIEHVGLVLPNAEHLSDFLLQRHARQQIRNATRIVASRLRQANRGLQEGVTVRNIGNNLRFDI